MFLFFFSSGGKMCLQNFKLFIIYFYCLHTVGSLLCVSHVPGVMKFHGINTALNVYATVLGQEVREIKGALCWGTQVGTGGVKRAKLLKWVDAFAFALDNLG